MSHHFQYTNILLTLQRKPHPTPPKELSINAHILIIFLQFRRLTTHSRDQ
jgi:hypothetical protein